MVYKRYIKKNGKKIGPYYYESYRDKNGKVVSRYLKNYKPLRKKDVNKKLILVSLIFLLAVLIILAVLELFFFRLDLSFHFLNFFITKMKTLTGNYLLNIFYKEAPVISQSTPGNIDSCQELDTPGIYTMTRNLEDEDLNLTGCFNITASNVELDCNGFYIRSASFTGYTKSGIYASKVANITIRNCNVSMGSSTRTGNNGVYFNGVNNSLIENTITNFNYNGIYLYSSSNNILTSNTANSNGNAGIIIFLSSNNKITNITANSNSALGIYLSSSSNNNIFTNINANSNFYGIYLESSSGNNLRDITTNLNNNLGLYLYLSSNNQITNITANSNSFGIYLYSSNNNTLSSTTSNYNANYGTYLSSSNNNALFLITSNLNYYGTYLSSSNNNALSSITANSNTYFGILISLGSNNNLINSIALNNSIPLRLWASGNNLITNFLIDKPIECAFGSSNNTCLNCSDSENCDFFSEIIRKWYLDVNANDITNNINQATVNSYNASNNLQVSSSTDSAGNSRQELIEYVNNGEVRSYYSNYSINVSKTGYYGNSSFVNMSGNKNLQIKLTAIAGTPDPPSPPPSGGTGGGGSGTGSGKNASSSLNKTGSGTGGNGGSEIAMIGKEDEFRYLENESENEAELASFLKKNCTPEWECGEWGDCGINYGLKDVIYGNVVFKGEEERVCKDKNKCSFDRVERRMCDTKETVVVKKGYNCSEGLIEIYDNNNILISRLDLSSEMKVNIQMSFDKEYHCPYCYDGIKDFDEAGIDCGGSCIECYEKTSKLSSLKKSKAAKIEFGSIPILIFLVIVFTLFIYLITLTIRNFILRKELKEVTGKRK